MIIIYLQIWEVFAPLPDIFLGTALEAHIMFLGTSLDMVLSIYREVPVRQIISSRAVVTIKVPGTIFTHSRDAYYFQNLSHYL